MLLSWFSALESDCKQKKSILDPDSRLNLYPIEIHRLEGRDLDSLYKKIRCSRFHFVLLTFFVFCVLSSLSSLFSSMLLAVLPHMLTAMLLYTTYCSPSSLSCSLSVQPLLLAILPHMLTSKPLSTTAHRSHAHCNAAVHYCSPPSLSCSPFLLAVLTFLHSVQLFFFSLVLPYLLDLQPLL
jgi:hypothetical protein